MNQHAHFTGFVQSLTASASKETIAVADAIGCPEMTDGRCNRKGECFCRTAAMRVAVIVREDS